MPKNINIQAEHERLVEKGREIVSKAPELLISVDIEADGRAGMGSMLAIGAVTPYNGSNFYGELRPTTDRFVPSQRKFCEENGLQRERLLREGRSARVVMNEFNRWVNRQAEEVYKPPVLVGYAAGWDHGFIDYYLASFDAPNPLGFASFDLKSRAMGINGHWSWLQTSKHDLPEEIVPPAQFTHNALEDAKWQQNLHFALAAYTLEQCGFSQRKGYQ